MSRKRPATATGVLVINKHAGVTSHDIVSAVRRLYNMSQVGHTGTLDPMATGVLPLLLGRAVKASEYLVAEDKEYVAEMTLGVTTDTEDTTGNVITSTDDLPDEEAVRAVCARFVGKIKQTPPMYSALKVGGKKLCDLAREGVEVEREAREIKVSSIEASRISDKVYALHVVCSKGTYIRTLCADIGKTLGCGAAMSSLCRTRSGPFTLDKSYTVEQLEALSFEDRTKLPAPTETLFESLPEVRLTDFNAKLIRGGTELYQAKLGTNFAVGTAVRLIHRGVFIALGRVDDFAAGSAVKPVKLFVI